MDNVALVITLSTAKTAPRIVSQAFRIYQLQLLANAPDDQGVDLVLDWSPNPGIGPCTRAEALAMLNAVREALGQLTPAHLA